jgi:hypothetical protein
MPEIEPEMLSEALWEAAEEVPWKKILQGMRGALEKNCNKTVTRQAAAGGLCGESRNQTKGDFMEPFNAKDAANIERVKDAMVELAVGKVGIGDIAIPDAAAAAAFASLLNAETERQKAVVAGQDKAAGAVGPSTWTEAVSAGGKPADNALATVM